MTSYPLLFVNFNTKKKGKIMADYIPKSSLDQQKENIEKREKLEPVVSSPTKTKKQTTWDKVKEEFVNGDGKSVGDYLLLDVLVPAIKQTIQAMINNGVDMILYGDSNYGRNRNSYQPGRTSYRQYYDQPRNNYSRPKIGSDYNYDEIVFGSRGDAELVLYYMRESIAKYRVVRVADYLEWSNRDSNFTDNNYGWTNLDYVQIRTTRDGGYYLDLPRPMALD